MTSRAVVVVGVGALLITGVAGAAPEAASRILFSADRAPLVSGEVYRVDARGHRVDLSRSPWNDALPVNSPDGSHVAFLSDRRGAPAVYTVAKTGRGLRMVARVRSPALDRTLYTWSPDGSTLAVVALDDGQQTLARGLLYVVRGGRTMKIASVGNAQGLSWTPDGRFITYHDGFALVARDARSGRVAWRLPIESASTTWTTRGLFAGDDGNGHIIVTDQSGGVRLHVAGSSASWSPDGRFLVSVNRGAVEIRDAALSVRRRVPINGLSGDVVPVWMRPHVLFVPARGTAYDLDVTTGRTRPDVGAWPLLVGRAGTAFVWTTRSGTGFAVHLQRGSSRPRVVVQVPGCHDDGALIPALDQLSPAADRTSIVYASHCYEPFGNLYALVGTRVQRLTTAQVEQVEPRASPDGSRIAYSQAPAVGLSCKGCPVSIWVANADGSHPNQLTATTESFDDDATWSPDGTTLLFARSDPSSFGQLFTVPAAGGAITPLHVAGTAPSWGPGGIAYIAVTSKGTAVWTARPDGTGAQRIYQGADPQAPAWSPDGRLAFVVGRRSIGVWNGAGVHLLTLPFGAVGSVAWSPDGTKLALAARAWGTPAFDVYTVRTDGTHIVRLTKDINVRDVSWR